MKKAIIVGASSGIGKELAKLLVKNDFKVGITGRRKELLEKIKLEHPDNYLIKIFDIRNTETTKEKLDELMNELGGLDLLILSSGTGEINDHLDFKIENRTIETNVIGWTCVVDWAFKYFEKRHYGHLAAITSVGGLRGSRQAPSYNATKSYQMNYLEGLRQKANHINKSITITDIRPGLVDTDMAKGEGLFWVMPVKKVTKQIFKAIKNKKKVVYVTKRWGMISKLIKLVPRFIYDKM